MKKKSFLLRDTKRIIKKSLKSILLTSILISFLFYLLNIFIGFSLKLNNIGDIITDKIGIYFYIQEGNDGSQETLKRIVEIKDDLAEKGIKSQFSSKDDGYIYLEDKIPEITQNFEKFGIENPLHSTLYVMFKNNKEYEDMKEVILKNKDIILNIKDIDEGATLIQQENRSLRIVNTMNIIRNSFYFIVIMVSIIIVFFTQHLLKHFFYDFYKEVEIKKLLGAKHKNVNGGFLITLLFTITIGFVLGFIMTCLTFKVLDTNLVHLGIDLELCNIIRKLGISYIVFSIIGLGLGYRMLKKMEKKF